MNSLAKNNDRELNEWLAGQEDAPALAAVAGRIGQFAADQAPAALPARQMLAGAWPRATVFSWRRVFPLSMAAMLLCGMAIGFYISRPPAPSELAWGDVVAAMQPVEHFHVTVFIDDPRHEPHTEHFDIFYQRPDGWRAQDMNFIQFGPGRNGRLYDIKAGKFVEAAQGFPTFIPSDLAQTVQEEGLLDAMIEKLFRAGPVPEKKIITDPALSESGIRVFDYDDQDGQFSARIWVLERSRLPIRMQVSYRGGQTVHAIMDYADARPKEFFDADSFNKNVSAGGRPTTNSTHDNTFALEEGDAWYKLACQWRQPADDLKYSENRADAATTRSTSKYQIGDKRIWFASFNTGPADKWPVYFAHNAETHLMDYPWLFIHQRTSSILGKTQLIAIDGHVCWLDGSKLELQCYVFAPPGASNAILSSAGVRVDMTGICGPGEIRIYAGQPDEKDPSKFSIPIEAGGKKGWIDGVFVGLAHEPLQSGDVVNREVQLSIRMADK